ncbi:DUF1349 domain-containing protein, partial [Akkermansiaceae bacterium]|nr:DUF1349 domain-containing protein [Akkermansiaceae bacterium]
DHWEIYDTRTRGSGLATINDSFVFASKIFCGNGRLSAKVQSMDNMTSDGFAGIMVRQTKEADSGMLMIGITPDGELLLSTRTENGGASTTAVGAAALALPVYFQISRTEKQFTSSFSTDGIIWTDLATLTLDLPITLRAGLASASGTTSSQGDVIFREWEHLDIATYPLRPRRLDGLPQFFAYALGLGDADSATEALPKLTLKLDAGLRYPELRFHRRIGIPDSQYSINWLGEKLNLNENDSANWSLLNITPNPNGISESVLLRRNGPSSSNRGFYSLGVEK